MTMTLEEMADRLLSLTPEEQAKLLRKVRAIPRDTGVRDETVYERLLRIEGFTRAALHLADARDDLHASNAPPIIAMLEHAHDELQALASHVSGDEDI